MEINLKGKNIVLQSIRLEDAEFVAQLRSDPRNYQFLSSNKVVTPYEQAKWLTDYLAKKDGYYFVLENLTNGKKVGTISLYNLDNKKRAAEFGRYIALDSISAIESEYLILKFAFDILQLDFLYCKTAEKNTKVWKQHSIFGFKDDGLEEHIEKAMLLKRQKISNAEYLNFDYSKIIKLINQFLR
jgi:RimJ/RimL family protein N-acetyltransferase